MPVVHAFDPPERFVAGTVGLPGQRTFFLQARTGTRLVSVALEKQQVAALAERVEELLDELMQVEADEMLIPALAPRDLVDDRPLEQPIDTEFRVGTMTLAWDRADQRVVIEVFPLDPDAPEPGEDAEVEAEEMLLVRLPAGAARSFVQRAQQVVGAGRPDCPFCGLPLDPEGHLCVRANGFRRRDP